jgi:hypothetical protein
MIGKKLVLLLTGCCLWFATFAQEQNPAHILWQATHQLVWQDFQGVVDVHNKYAAQAAAGINFSYQAMGRQGAWKLTFVVNSYFDRSQSWGKPDKKTPYLLAHEQLHFDIAELHARRLKRDLESYKFTKNFKSEVNTLFAANMANLKKMQSAYDYETDHSKNEEQQQVWVKYVRQELLNLEQTSASTQ